MVLYFLGHTREVHQNFLNEIPENACSIRFPTRNFRNFLSNGKRLFTPGNVMLVKRGICTGLMGHLARVLTALCIVREGKRIYLFFFFN